MLCCCARGADPRKVAPVYANACAGSAGRVASATTGAGGTDLDGDTNTDDRVTHAVSLTGGTQYSANLEADAAFLIGNFAWLVVDELKTGVDHNGVGGVRGCQSSTGGRLP